MVFDVGIRNEWFSIWEFVSVATLVLISVSMGCTNEKKRTTTSKKKTRRSKKSNIVDWGKKRIPVRFSEEDDIPRHIYLFRFMEWIDTRHNLFSTILYDFTGISYDVT